MTHDFANIDDQDYVFENAYVQKGFTLETIKWAFTPSTKENRSYWHPITWLSHMLDCSLFGLDAGNHHLVSLGMHTVSAILLFLVFFHMTGARWKSAFVAALFAIHPLNVESVAWIAERKNVLSGVFWMLSLMAYFYYSQRPCVMRYFLLLLAFLLGLLSKPMLVTLPVILLLIDIWPLGRLDSPKSFFRLLIEKMPLLIFALAIFIIVYLSIHANKLAIASELIPLDLRIANAITTCLKYLVKTIWPHPLAVFYPFPEDIPFWKTLGSFAVLLAITALSLVCIKKAPWVFVGWSWFLVALSPVSGIIQVGLWPEMADRFAYMPSIGLFVIIAWGWEAVSIKFPYKQIISALLAIAVLISFTWLTRQQLSYWQNASILFEHTLSVTRENPIALFGYANGLEREGLTDPAIEKYYQVLSLRHDYEPAHTNLGNIFYNRRQFEKAVYHYTLAMRMKPDSVKARLNLANAYAALGKFNEALAHYQKASDIEPDNPMIQENIGVQINMGNSLSQVGRINDAMNHYKTALELDPNNASVLNNIGNTYMQIGNMAAAMQYYARTLDIAPDHIHAQKNLEAIINIRAQSLGNSKAIAELTAIIDQYPDVGFLYYHAARLYARQKDADAALQWFHRAVERGYHDWEKLETDSDMKSVCNSDYYKNLIKSN